MMDNKRSTTKFLTFMLFFILCCENVCLGADGVTCKENERKALLSFKQGLIDDDGLLSSWGSQEDKKECCNWEGVVCSNQTGHVVRLDLNVFGIRGEIRPALADLHHLSYLDLGINDFGRNKIPEFIGSFKKLEYLNLAGSNFSGDVPYQLGNLKNLRELDLCNNNLTSKDITWLSNLSFLSSLVLSDNQFTAPLSDFTYLTNLSLLSKLDLSHNKFRGPFPNLKPFPSLRELSFSDNKLTGFPTTIFQLFELEKIYVAKNYLQGVISEVHLSKLRNLKYLDLSYNSLTLNLTPEWVPPFQLEDLKLARCKMGPRFPAWIRTQTKIRYLDISSNGIIASQAPNWLWDQSHGISWLDLSDNQFSGSIPSTSRFLTLNLSSNNFSGHVPLFHPDSYILQLSGNSFTGSIQSLCRVADTFLRILDLSKNQLSGDIPNCWQHMSYLASLNLGDNKFHGHIPYGLGSLQYLQILILRNNNLTGELSFRLKNLTSLGLIDVGGNKLTGNLSNWLGEIPRVSVFSLRRNHFYGSIPLDICRLENVQVLDLSHNSLSGTIPQCFNRLKRLRLINEDPDGLFDKTLVTYPYVYNAMVEWKRTESEYKNTLQFLRLIDLSSNKLVGNIPPEISCLVTLGSLNLSRNYLTGNITRDIDAMTILEILDLSKNNLSGEIPTNLAKLHYLSVLDLSDNSLSGKIPKGTQLQTFDVSTYAGNKELCGAPLSNCPGDSTTRTSANHGNQQESIIEGGFNTIQSLFEDYFISAILGFIVGFWGIMGPISFKRSWRNAYYGYWSKLGDRLYVTIAIWKTRFR